MKDIRYPRWEDSHITKSIRRELWILLALPMLLGLASCMSDNDDNPVIIPDEPQQQLADYTIIYYGHGGGNLDYWLLQDIGQFYLSDTESRRNVSICAQYKFSTLKGLQEGYEDYKNEIDPNDPAQLEELEGIKSLYPFAGKTCRFVVGGEATAADMMADVTDSFIGPDNAEITRTDSLANFIDWAVRVCPARKYVLLLADHGDGYLPHEELPATDAAGATRVVVKDDGHNKRAFTAKTLAQAISQASLRPSAVYCDACLMNAAEYHFELAPVTDYLVLSTFLVPSSGGDYTELVNALSAHPDDLEQGLTRYAKACVEAWDKEGEGKEEFEYRYHNMNVYRTAATDAFGAELKKFVDRLVDAYQNGGDEVRAKIDEMTAHAYLVDSEQPIYDLMHYVFGLSTALSDVFGPAYGGLADQFYNHCVVHEQSGKWLEENAHIVSLSVLLGCQGHYLNKEDGSYYLYDADGLRYSLQDGERTGEGLPWGSTLDATYGQLRFDQITGWSRWLRLNRQEPNLECFYEYRDFLDKQ